MSLAASGASTATPTQAIQQALDELDDASAAADLLFLDAWERSPRWGAGIALRVSQIRRANPELAAAVRAELDARRRG